MKNIIQYVREMDFDDFLQDLIAGICFFAMVYLGLLALLFVG